MSDGKTVIIGQFILEVPEGNKHGCSIPEEGHVTPSMHMQEC